MLKKFKIETLFAYIILVAAALICLIPLLIVVSASFSDGMDLLRNGYSVFPRIFSLEGYKIIFQNPGMLKNAYITTIASTAIGTVLSLAFTAMAAYPLSRSDYKWRGRISFYFYFTMLFSGGMIPTYILISQYLNLRDTFWVLIIPNLLNIWNVLVLRTYFSQVSMSVIESAKIDGASEFRTFLTIVIPMSQVGIATIGFLIGMRFWNDWYTSFMYMSNNKYITLQYFLQQTMSHVQSMLEASNNGTAMIDPNTLPSETVRMGMCVLAVGPMLFVFMFFQKYFTKGISLGAVKG